jgi:hypothetical protein
MPHVRQAKSRALIPHPISCLVGRVESDTLSRAYQVVGIRGHISAY